MYAHYFTQGKSKFVVFTEGPAPSLSAKRHPVSGKVEARALAKDAGAKPWNF